MSSAAKRVAAVVGTIAVVAGIGRLIRASVPQVPSNTWTQTGDMAQARAGAAATLLFDGHVLVTGGLDANGAATATAERYAPDGGGFLDTPAMSTPRANHTSTLLPDGRVLVAGGVNASGQALSSAEIYDPTTNAWTPAASLNVARADHTATALYDGRIVIAGGDSAGAPIASIELFDLYTNGGTFTASASSLTSARTGHAAALTYDNLVVVAGGFDGTAPLASIDIYDPNFDTVTAGTAMSAGRAGLSATTLLDGKILLAGGAGATSELATAEVYDPASNTIAATASTMLTARQRHQAILLPHNNQVLIVGGTAGGDAVAAAELYVEWQGTGGTFYPANVPMNSDGTPRTPGTARAWATAAPLSFPAGLTIRTGPNDGLMLLTGGSAAASGSAPFTSSELFGFATVTTDRADYAPGTTVTISGAGWVPGETVTLTMVESPLLDSHPLQPVVADGSGHIVSTEFVPDANDVGVRFFLTATGTQSQAQTSFTDAKPNTVLLTPGSITVAPGGGAAYVVTVGFNGNGVSCTADLSVTTALPTGATASFSPSSVTSTGPNQTSTLTITTTGATPVGSTNFTVQAAGRPGCQSPGTATGTGTLVVTSKKVGSVSVGSQVGTLTYGTGSSAAYLVTVNRNGATGVAFSAALSVASTLPAGATASFSPSTVAFGANDTSKTSTLTVSTAAATPAGSAVFTVQAANTTVAGDLAAGNGSLSIGTKPITAAVAASNKTYDGSNTATIATCSPSGLLAVDAANVTCSAAGPNTFSDKNVGIGKTVTATNIALSGSAAGNYQLSSTTATTTANITPRNLTVTAGGVNKTYDGTPTATVTLSDDHISGDAVTDSYASASFADKTVATGKVVSVTGISISGADSTNYTLVNTTASTTADITARGLTVSATGVDKTYDGTTAATVTLSDNRVPGDSITDAYTSASFSDKNVGTGKTVNVFGITISGADAANYSLASTTTSTTASITGRNLTITAAGKDRVYDGTTNATVTLSDDRVAGDVFTDSYASASFADKNVGINKPVSVTGLSISGADAGNYSVANTTATTTANITARPLTVSATGVDKLYDATTVATVTLSDDRVNGDMLTDAYTSAAFADPNVGTNKPITVTGITVSGADAGNYTFNTTAATTASILKRALTITPDGGKTKTFGRTFTAFTGVIAGLQGADAATATFASAGAPASAGAGSYDITVSGYTFTVGTDTNYAIAENTAVNGLTVEPAVPSLVLLGTTVTYDSLAHPATVSVTGAGGAAVSGTPVFAYAPGGSPDPVQAGSYRAAVTFTSADPNYTSAALGVTTRSPGWSGAAPSSSAHHGASAGVINGQLYVAGGDPAYATDAYDPTTDTWTAKASEPTPRAYAASGVIGGKLYVAGGCVNADCGVGYSDVLEIYEAATDTWTVGHPMPTKRAQAAGGVIDGKLYVAGGFQMCGPCTPLSTLEVYDPATDTWSTKASLPTPVANAASAVVNGTLYVIGGSGTALVQKYDPATDSWSAGTPLANPLAGAAAAAINARIYVAGGNTDVTDVLSYDTWSDTWTTEAPMTQGRHNPTAGVVGGVLYLVGGAVGFAQQTTNEAFNPAAVVTIKPKTVTASVTADSRIYDGGNLATIANCSLSGVEPSDTGNVTCSAGGPNTFADKNVGTGKTVTATNISLGGNASGNYMLSATTATTTADITARSLHVTATADDKVYDGNTTAVAHLTDDRVSGDLFSDTYTTATFSDKNVGFGKTVSVAGIGITGADAGNYSLQSTTASTAASITARPATWTTQPNGKTYGDADPSPLTTGSGAGFVPGDVVAATYSRMPGEDANAYPIVASLGPVAVVSNYAITNLGSTFTINKRPTTTTVTSNPSGLVTFGQPVTFTATVAGQPAFAIVPPFAVPTGTVSFLDGGNPIASCSNLSLSGGSAQCTVPNLGFGPHTISASYSGDGNYLDSVNSNTSGVSVSDVIICSCDSASTIPARFNAKPIAQGSFIWFNNSFELKHVGRAGNEHDDRDEADEDDNNENEVWEAIVSGNKPVTIRFDQQTITFKSGTTTYGPLAVPNATITFDPNATMATTSFNAMTNTWETVAPVPSTGLSGRVFASGLAWQVPAPLAGGINPVTWTARITSDTPGLRVRWTWSATVFSTLPSDYNAFGVKAASGRTVTPFGNSDRAGTPENEKQFALDGARGHGHNGAGWRSRSATTGQCGVGTWSTFTQTEWSQAPDKYGKKVAPGLLADGFTGPITIGSTDPGKFRLTFTSVDAIRQFLPAGGRAGVLQASAINPRNSRAGVFAGQVLALKLNVLFSGKNGLADLYLVDGPLAGTTVQHVLDLANEVLGGNAGMLPAGLTIDSLEDIVTNINEDFDAGAIDRGYLLPYPLT